MIADALLDFYADLKAALTTSKVVDLKQDHPNLGSCVPPFYVILKVKDTSGDGTVTFNLQDSADNSAFATVASVTVAGKDLVDTAIPVPVKHRRYLKPARSSELCSTTSTTCRVRLGLKATIKSRPLPDNT